MARTHVSGFFLAVSLIAALAFHGCCTCPSPKARPHTLVTAVFQTPPANPATPAGNGSSYSTVVATGVFDGASGVCLYDVTVSYQRKVSEFEVYAAPMSVATGTGAGQIPGPTGDDTYLVYRDPTDTASGSGTWARSDLPGTYTGATQYKMLVRVTYVQTTLGVDSHWGRLDDITGEWVPTGL